MSVIGSNILAGSSGVSDAYTIDQSLRFDDGDSPYLSRTPGSAGNRKTWTWSGWVKRGNLVGTGACQYIFSAADSNETSLRWDNLVDDALTFFDIESASYRMNLITDALYRDVSAWYHIVVAVDTTDGTPADRQKIYVNGERITSFSTETTYDADDETWVNSTTPQYLGKYQSGYFYLDGYLAEVYLIDGTALTPSSFGETDSTTNQWKPIEYSGSYGTNGFYQKYASTELANSFTDSSGGFFPSEDLTVDALIVAGGGGGAGTADAGAGSGGGGAGGYRSITGISVTASTGYGITVGAGGSAGPATYGTQGGDGGDSSFNTYSSTGGGGGGTAGDAGNTPGWGQPGRSGGSGGGGGTSSQDGGSGNAGGYSPVEGYAGGTSVGSAAGSAGGGASGVGGSATGNRGSDAGDGIANSITGSSVTYAGGGGGGSRNTISGDPGAGGSGGGGNGDGSAGTPNTGGGGGGNKGGSSAAGGAGGSGVVIIRYISTTEKAIGGTITSYTDGGNTYQVHTFTSSAAPHTITAVGDVANTRAQQKVGDSSIVFDGTGDYLSTPGSSDWAFTGEFTIEMWARGSAWDADDDVLTCYGGGGGSGRNSIQFWVFGSSSDLVFYCSSDGDNWTSVSETKAFTNDTWYHIAVTRDGSDVVHLWVDGTELGTGTAFSGTLWTPTTYDLLTMGAKTHGASQAFTGYMDEIRFSDTDRYPSAFTPSTTEFTTDSNTKLLIHSNWDGGLGADSSGNENDFAATNLVATDQMEDSPTNNFATLNPLFFRTSYKPTYTEGNLEATPIGSNQAPSMATIGGLQSGKWYFEFYVESISSGTEVGIVEATPPMTYIESNTDLTSRIYRSGGNKESDGSASSYGASYTAGDIIGVALNITDGELTFYKNNATQTVAFTDIASAMPSGGWTFFIEQVSTSNTGIVNFGQDSSFAGNETAQGNQDGNSIGDFYYEPPSGFLALCTSNLAAPSIADPTAHFNTTIWTGDDADPRTISGLNFQPDAIWVKARSGTYGTQDHCLNDAVRGAGEILRPNQGLAEATDTNNIESFTSDGWTMGDDGKTNKGSTYYVAWSWKGDGASGGTLNQDGTVDSQVNVNTTAGFSIVTYTGTGSDDGSDNVGHGLAQTPEFYVIKNRSGTDGWNLYTAPTGTGNYMTLNNTIASASASNGFQYNNAPTASVFTLGTWDAVNKLDEEYVAYAFHSVEGYSKVGSYDGNGDSSDGTFVYCGFSPAWVMFKNVDEAYAWVMYDNKRDTYNVKGDSLYADDNAAETDDTQNLDFVSNGFKFRDNSYQNNYASNTYVYLAFAESPFKTANAR